MLRLLGLLPFFIFVKAHGTLPPNLGKKSLRLQAEINYFNSEANFDSEGGAFEELGNGQYYRNISGKFGGFYSYNPKFAFSTYISVANASSLSISDERTNTELAEYEASVYYQYFRDPLEFIPTFRLAIPFNRVDPETDDVLTGEGALQLEAGAWSIKDFDSFYGFFYFGYNYRDEGRSALLPYKLGLEIDFSGLYIGGQITGFESVSDDTFTDTPVERTSITDAVNAGSLAVYSINPSELAFNVWFALDFTKTNYFYFGYGRTIDGRNSAEGEFLFAGVEISIDMKRNQKSSGIFGKKAKKEVNRFQIEAEEKKQDIFDEDLHKKRRRIKRQEQQHLKEAEEYFENQ